MNPPNSTFRSFFVLRFCPVAVGVPFRKYLLERCCGQLEIFCSSFWSFCQVLVEADGEV